MTLFAGAYCVNPAEQLPDLLKQSLKQHLRRKVDGRGSMATHDVPGMFLTKWDSGAFAEAAWKALADGSLFTLVGDPLLSASSGRLHRADQLRQLISTDGALINGVLSQTRGSFSVASYSGPNHALSLATDMVGLRSLYYTVQDGVLIFASALRILESMDCVVKKLSTPGIVESSVFGFPLAERTIYKGISVLRECQKMTISTGRAPQLTSYGDWSVTASTQAEPGMAAQLLFDEFQEGIRLRAASDRKVYAFLSGGMDSRAIVSSLLSHNRKVEALNFSPELSQDQEYARLFANSVGSQCNLHFLPRDENPNFSMLAYGAKLKLEKDCDVGVDRPAFLWSGDGGSVGLGHVYMNERMLDFADDGDLEAAVKHFLEFNRLGVSVGVLMKGAREPMRRLIFENVMSEVRRYPRADAGRCLYLFLLFNDQRRHLFKHFESIDLHGLEFLLPFYDTKFLRRVVDTPVRWGVLHKLYSAWFDHLAPNARSTPWQTYPGHLPCPIEGDDTLSYQWTDQKKQRGPGFRDRVAGALYLLKHGINPSLPEIFSKQRLLLVVMLHGMGLRDCSHIITMVTGIRPARPKAEPTRRYDLE